MTTHISLPDPVVYPDRVCAGADQNLFFPGTRRKADAEPAKAACRRCPRLQACAAWAAPQVRSGRISGCVVAAVYAPSPNRGASARGAAALQLEAIAAQLTGTVEEVA